MTPGAALFFAAGLGTRMRPLTDARPKPLVTVGGRTLIDHALDLAEAAGIGRRVVNLHYRAGMLRAHLADRRVLFSDETDLLRDTGGGLRHALPLLGAGPVWTMNTDAVWSGPNPFGVLAPAWDPARMQALLLLVPRANATAHAGAGDFAIDDTGRIAPGPGHVYTGLQIIDPALIAGGIGAAFPMWALWNRALAGGTAFGLSYPGHWCDVGRPESIPLAEAVLNV